MNRFFLVVALSTIVAGATYAGPIAINLGTAGNAGASVLNKNLAGNGYLPCNQGTTTNGDVCTTSDSTVAPPPSGAPTSFTSVLYKGVPVPFDIASGGANSSSGAGDTSNIWAPGNSAGNQSKTIDVGTYTTNASGVSTSGSESGLFGVDQIWTMINDVYATPGYQGITLTLSGYAANGVTPITETIDLTAGVDYRSIGQTSIGVNDFTACDVANQGGATLGANCSAHASSTTPSVGTDSSYNATNVSEGVSVTVYNDLFVTQDTLATPDSYWLDAQDINLGSAFLNGWLNSVTITSNDGTGIQEKAILSALTVDTVVPEPGTVFLFGTGLAGLVLFQLKRTKKA
jgi:hypothetical protein